MPPTPPVPAVVRVRFQWDVDASRPSGCGLHFKVSGGPPDEADLTSFATAISAAYSSHLAGYALASTALTSVEATDISSDSGAQGTWTGNIPGTSGASGMGAGVATLINFSISRRYRGGKPRIYLPLQDAEDLDGTNQWTSGYITAINAAWSAFSAEVIALSYSSFDVVDDVNVSYYEGFTAVENPITGRWRNVPTLRAEPVVDSINAHSTASKISSQRRRLRV